MATYSGYERFLPAGNVPLSAKRAKGGGLKFTITTGYVPTLGFRESDFKPSHSAMKGTLQNYGDILDEQGNIKQARIPGTVAWFEYSTALKGVRGLIKAHVPNGEEQLAQMSQTFYERYSKPNQKLISQESVQKLIPKMFKEPKSKAKDTQQMNLYGIPESDLISERDADILYEDTKAIDYYMRDKGGNIYRFDMSTENIDALFEKEMGAPLAGAGGQVINEQGMLMDDAQQQLLDYFQRLQDTKWNPGIRAIKDIVHAQGKSMAKTLLTRLQGIEPGGLPQQTNLETEATSQRTYSDLFGKGSDQYYGDKRFKPSKDFDRFRMAALMKRMIGLARTRTSTMGIYQAKANSMEFIIKMLGNVVNLFSANSTIPGGLSVGYEMGGGQFTVEVIHRLHGSGLQVFEFVDKKLQDIYIHEGTNIVRAIWERIHQESHKHANLNLTQAAMSVDQTKVAKQVVDTQTAISTEYIHAASDPTQSVSLQGKLLMPPDEAIKNILERHVADAFRSTDTREINKFLRKNLQDLTKKDSKTYQFKKEPSPSFGGQRGPFAVTGGVATMWKKAFANEYPYPLRPMTQKRIKNISRSQGYGSYIAQGTEAIFGEGDAYQDKVIEREAYPDYMKLGTGASREPGNLSSLITPPRSGLGKKQLLKISEAKRLFQRSREFTSEPKPGWAPYDAKDFILPRFWAAPYIGLIR